MPYTKDQLISTIEDTVVNKRKHKHYDRVTKLATKYKQLITGEDIDSLLHQFVRREDDALFQQRKRLTQQITPAVIAALMNPFYKVGRTNNITKKISLKKSDNSIKDTDKITDAINTFWGKRPLDDYLETRFTELSFSDPNAFIITEFDQAPVNGVMEEIPKPRAFEVPSANAINYEIDNNILEWLIIELPNEYTEGEKSFPGKAYTIYGPEYAIKFEQIGANDYGNIKVGTYLDIKVTDGISIKNVKVFRATEKEFYLVTEYNHKAKEVPAIIVGYKSDLQTEGQTYVSPFHDAMPYLMKSIKTVSEYDLTMSLHAFPQKFGYAPRCSGESATIGCDAGKNPEGNNCTKCKGTGLAIHTSAQDAIILRMPPKGEEMTDLSKLVYYAAPSIDIVKFQNEYIQQLKDETRQAVFNSEIFSQNEVAATATEKKISLESVYDTLFPYSKKFSEVYVHEVRISAYYLDIVDLIIIHQFPKDFKFKTVTDLLGELKLANDSNAPGYVRKELSNDIASAQFIDKPEELKKIRIKEKHYPFSDKTDTEIIYIISNAKTTNFNAVLWANFDSIFQEIEEDENLAESFYLMPYAKRKEIILAKVKEILTEIEKDTPPAVLPFGQVQ